MRKPESDPGTPRSEASRTTGTPVTRRGLATRQRIVDAAADLFYRNGVARTGLADIITASHTGKGQLYYYFADKTQIVAAVIAAQTASTIHAQQTTLDAISSIRDLRTWADEAVAAHQHGRPARCPLGALTVGVADSDPDLRLDLDASFTRWRTALSVGITRLQEAGHVRRDRPADDLAELLLCSYEGGLVLAEARADLRPLRLSLAATIDAMTTR
jgi:TetR/AcrR family transcriptional regulator, transcriptional repressor for nem operon